MDIKNGPGNVVNKSHIIDIIWRSLKLIFATENVQLNTALIFSYIYCFKSVKDFTCHTEVGKNLILYTYRMCVEMNGRRSVCVSL
jgi:hypothetical protein